MLPHTITDLVEEKNTLQVFGFLSKWFWLIVYNSFKNLILRAL